MAITNEILYKAALNITRKDVKGQAFNPQEFARYLWLASNDYYDQQYQRYMRTGRFPSPLNPYRVKGAPVALTNGVGSMPSTYHALLGRPKWGTVTVAMVDDEKYNLLQDHTLMKPTPRKPIGRILYSDDADTYTDDEWQITVYPTTAFASENLTIDYLRTPKQPILDYYIDANGAYQYLAEGEDHTVVASETFPLASTAPSTGSTYESTTIEMLWEDTDKENILYMLLAYAGITVNRADVGQYFDSKRIETIQIQNTE
jgi:hypothetical protein